MRPRGGSATDPRDTWPAIRAGLLAAVAGLHVEYDGPLRDWWTERNATLALVEKIIKRYKPERHQP
jgi:hypothetical protein